MEPEKLMKIKMLVEQLSEALADLEGESSELASEDDEAAPEAAVITVASKEDGGEDKSLRKQMEAARLKKMFAAGA